MARSQESLSRLAADVPGALTVAGDATKVIDVERAFAETRMRFAVIDLVVVAISPTGGMRRWGGGDVAESEPADFAPYLDELLPATVNVLRVGSRLLKQQGHGTYVQITGGSARRGRPGIGAWAATAFASRGLLQAAAGELRRARRARGPVDRRRHDREREDARATGRQAAGAIGDRRGCRPCNRLPRVAIGAGLDARAPDHASGRRLGPVGGAGRAPRMTGRGAVAEWLGRGLQSLVQRFESAPRLNIPQRASFSGSHSLRQRCFGEPHPGDQFVLVRVHVVLARRRDRGVRPCGAARASGSRPPRLAQAALEPAVHRRGLHRPVAVLAHDALQVRVRAPVADADRVENILVGLSVGLNDQRACPLCPRASRSQPCLYELGRQVGRGRISQKSGGERVPLHARR